MRIVRVGLVLALAWLLTGCYVSRLGSDTERIRPSGNIVTETRSVGAFHSIAGAGSVSDYGDPATDTEVTGLGSWKALGAKSREM